MLREPHASLQTWIETAPCSLLYRNCGQISILTQVPKLDQVNMLLHLITILRELHLLFSPLSIQDVAYGMYPSLSC